MIASILTTFFFALSAICGKRTAEIFGSLGGNFWRLLLAALTLGAITLAFDPDSFANRTFLWFFISGVVGFGAGDVALFLAYPRLGSRLTMLINLCFAPLAGAIGEFAWLGTRITLAELGAIAAILAGVLIALLPERHATRPRAAYLSGILLATVAGAGQGFGAVLSRHAETIAIAEAVDVTGMSAAFQRIVGGLLIGFVACVVTRTFRPPKNARPSALSRPRAMSWLVGAALFGPVIGVSCFQWALQTTPSAIVLAIVSTTPIVLIPLAVMLENDRPSRKSVLGAVIAVAGVAAICLLRYG